MAQEVILNIRDAGVNVTRRYDKLFVHLTTPEAIALAPRFLPPTRRVVTREGETWVYTDSTRTAGVN